MQVQVLYFASLREKVGTASEPVELPEGCTTVAALRSLIASRAGAWEAVQGPRIRAALNQEFAEGPEELSDGDEVAFFPPVTGG